MGLSSLTGTSQMEPKSPAPSSNEYLQQEIDVTQTPDQRIVDKGPVLDSFHNDNVLDMNRYGSIIAQIRQYVEGSPVYVTYYHTVASENARTGDADLDTDGISPTYRRINDFEIRLADGLDYSHLTEENVSQYVGSATVYPGLVPHIGDFFLYTVDNATGTIGKFKITEVERLSIKHQTCHRVNLELIGFVDQTQIDQMESQVIDVLYFDLRSFLGDQSVLLRTSQKQLIHDVDTLEHTLKKFYIHKFFDSSKHHTFVRPDGVFDPYLADFVMYLFKYEELPEYPHILMDPPANIYSSFWSGLMDRNSVTPNTVFTHFLIYTLTAEARNGFITSLLNHDYLHLCNESEENAQPYISTGISSLDGAEQSDFDRLVRLFYEQRQIDPTALLQQSQDFRSLSETDQFYRIPVFMFLLSLLRQTIFSGSGDIAYGDSVTYYPTEYEFTSEDLNDQYLILQMNNKAIGVITPDGQQKMLQTDEVVYNSGNIHVYLGRIIEEEYSTWQFNSGISPYSASWTTGSSIIEVENASGIEVGMAVQATNGEITHPARVQSINGLEITLTEQVDSTADVTDQDVYIDYPIFTGTWKLVLTGNTEKG